MPESSWSVSKTKQRILDDFEGGNKVGEHCVRQRLGIFAQDLCKLFRKVSEPCERAVNLVKQNRPLSVACVAILHALDGFGQLRKESEAKADPSITIRTQERFQGRLDASQVKSCAMGNSLEKSKGTTSTGGVQRNSGHRDDLRWHPCRSDELAKAHLKGGSGKISMEYSLGRHTLAPFTPYHVYTSIRHLMPTTQPEDIVGTGTRIRKRRSYLLQKGCAAEVIKVVL